VKQDCNATLLALALLLVPCTALCQPTPTDVFQGTLSGSAVNPPNLSAGTGLVEMIHDPFTHTLSVNLSFSNLSALATAAHIHCCATPPTNVGVAIIFITFPAGVTSGSFQPLLELGNSGTYLAGFLSGSGGTAAGAEAALLQALRNGNAYTDIHSSMYPGGEVRAYLNWDMFRDGFESADMPLLRTRQALQCGGSLMVPCRNNGQTGVLAQAMLQPFPIWGPGGE